MIKVLFAGLMLLVISATSAISQTGTNGLELPAPPDATLAQEVDLDPARLMDIIRAGDSDLEQFIKEIRRCHLVSYRLNSAISLGDLLKSYVSPLQAQGWHQIVRDEKTAQPTAIFERPSGGLMIMALNQKEFAIIRVEGTFDFTSFRGQGAKGAGNSSNAAAQPFNFEEVPMGNPEWTEDAARKLVTGTRSYRPAIISVANSGKLSIEGFGADPQITQWDRNEIVLDYRKNFSGSSRDSALENERRCLIVVNVAPGSVQMRQALVPPAKNTDCGASLKVTVPNAWKVDVLRRN